MATDTAEKIEFDPAAVTVESVVALSGPKCRQVIAHYGLPAPKSGAPVSEVRKWAGAAILAGQAQADEVADATPDPAPDPTPEPAVEKGSPGVEVEVRDPSQEIEVIPPAAKWQQLVAMGEFLHKSSLCPRALKSAADVTVILLAANDLGIPLTQALDKIHVINGRKGMAGELMSAVILRDGHELWPDPDNGNEWATVYGRRRNSDGSLGNVVSATFTIEEAIQAKLVGRAPDGSLIARKDGKPLPWESYTSDMLYWRALARLARRSFPDCLGGVSYTPDELGYIDAEDSAPKGRAAVEEPTISLAEQRDVLAARIQALDEDLRTELVEAWKKRGLKRISESTPGALRTGSRLVDEFEKRQEERGDGTEDVAEAEVVPDAPGDEAGPEEAQAPTGAGVQEAETVPDDPDDPEIEEADTSTADGENSAGGIPECSTPACSMPGTIDGYCPDHEVM